MPSVPFSLVPMSIVLFSSRHVIRTLSISEKWADATITLKSFIYHRMMGNWKQLGCFTFSMHPLCLPNSCSWIWEAKSGHITVPTQPHFEPASDTSKFSKYHHHRNLLVSTNRIHVLRNVVNWTNHPFAWSKPWILGMLRAKHAGAAFESVADFFATSDWERPHKGWPSRPWLILATHAVSVDDD